MLFDVFAGPMIRRAEEKRVVVWIAMLSGPPFLFASVYAADGTQLGQAQTTSVKVGGLLVHLAVVTPHKGTFPRGQVLQYGLGVNLTTGSVDESDFIKWVKAARITYNEASRPSFILQSEGEPLRFAAGSCRKFHDPGPDALALFDDAVAAKRRNPQEWVHALLLTGDQIYGDDVDLASTLPAVTVLARRLGLTETLPGMSKSTDACSTRDDIVAKANLTSGESKGHLLSLGEYLALYSLAWSPDNWSGQVPAQGETVNFRRTLGKARRALANVPTYMIFDDHDVTDDWFITNTWKNRVRGHPQGLRIISNALAAYWLMQGWANDPDRFEVPRIKAVIEARAADLSNAAAAKAFDDGFLGQDWEFAVPSEPPVYMLDTRTRRGGTGFPPVLKTKEAWTSSKIFVRNKDRPFILVAPAPLFTSTTMEALQRAAVALPGGKLDKDLEGWAANAESLILLFDKLRFEALFKVVVLSGDVHYYYSAPFELMDRSAFLGQGGTRIRGLQITSSALKNGGMEGWQAPVVRGAPYYLFLRRGSTESMVRQATDVSVKDRKIIIRVPVLGNVELAQSSYPDVVAMIRMTSVAPKAAPIAQDHNFLRATVKQNEITYSFNSGVDYVCTL